SQSISNLSPGTYTVSVTDANGCVVSQSVTVNSVDCAISATSQVTDVICPGGADGAATVSVTGGLEPLTYNWSNGATSESISGLTAGNYAVTVTDDAGCIAQA
ncbi:MAG: SprB repeat-containing protein, partial [Bacteroidota bacterium]